MTDFDEPTDPTDDLTMLRTYKITYHSPHTDGCDDVYGSVEIDSTHLPNHHVIMSILNNELPDRPRGGWYEMETIGPSTTSPGD